MVSVQPQVRYAQLVPHAVFCELNAMKMLKHDAIPMVTDIVEEDEIVCLVREYVEGNTLSAIAEAAGAQSPDNVIEWGKQIM